MLSLKRLFFPYNKGSIAVLKGLVDLSKERPAERGFTLSDLTEKLEGVVDFIKIATTIPRFEARGYVQNTGMSRLTSGKSLKDWKITDIGLQFLKEQTI